jgi:hypothetical protein
VTIPLRNTEMLAHYGRLKMRFAKRESNAELIHQVRQGNIRQLFPEELNFSISFNGSPIANFVDIVAHDMAEGLAPLPALACTSGKMKSDADLKRAERKNRIGDNYWLRSRLELQMESAADRFVTYGWFPIFVEPDTKAQLPYIHLEDPRGSYYELDRMGRCKIYAHRWRRSVDDLCAQFPEFAGTIRSDPKTGRSVPGETELELVRWVDETYVSLILPDRNGLILSAYAHKLDRCPVWIAERPGEGDHPRGQFDDVVWVQVARSIMSTLALEAASIAVQSPIAVPSDMDELAIGPHAILQSDNAKDIHKVGLDLPSSIFAEGQVLDQELRVGSRYPDARTGSVNASVITGKGVTALLGTFDSQIRGGQVVLREALQQTTAICFEMDAKWWPNTSKRLTGTVAGSSYEFEYIPSVDIGDRFDCTVTYGFSMGMEPSQSLIAILQLEGAGLISKSTARENLPMPIDSIQEQKRADIEGSREALKQGVFALVQASGQMAAQGQDPTPIIKMAVQTIQGLEDGMTIEDAVSEAYAAMEQAQQQAAQQAAEQQAQMQAQAQGGTPGAPQDPNAPQGGAQGQGGVSVPDAGPPSMQEMVTGFRGDADRPVLQNQIRSSQPVGA